MGQATHLSEASVDLRSAALQCNGAAAQLEDMVGTMSGIVHGLISGWSGPGSLGFVAAWQKAARDGYRSIESFAGTAGAMTQLANAIDDNVGAISTAESMANEAPHSSNFVQHLHSAETQATQALSSIASIVSSLVGQLQIVVVPLTTGGCSTIQWPLLPGQFDGVSAQPQPAGPNGPGGWPPGLVALMDSGGDAAAGGGAAAGGDKGGIGLLRLLSSIGLAAYETYPTFKDEGYKFDGKVLETFTINFTLSYVEGPEAALKGSAGAKFAGHAAIESWLQIAPEIQQEAKDRTLDPGLLAYQFVYHFIANMALDSLGDAIKLKPDAGNEGINRFVDMFNGVTDTQLEQLVGSPKALHTTLDKILALLPPLTSDTQIPPPPRPNHMMHL